MLFDFVLEIAYDHVGEFAKRIENFVVDGFRRGLKPQVPQPPCKCNSISLKLKPFAVDVNELTFTIVASLNCTGKRAGCAGEFQELAIFGAPTGGIPVPVAARLGLSGELKTPVVVCKGGCNGQTNVTAKPAFARGPALVKNARRGMTFRIFIQSHCVGGPWKLQSFDIVIDSNGRLVTHGLIDPN